MSPLRGEQKVVKRDPESEMGSPWWLQMRRVMSSANMGSTHLGKCKTFAEALTKAQGLMEHVDEEGVGIFLTRFGDGYSPCWVIHKDGKPYIEWLPSVADLYHFFEDVKREQGVDTVIFRSQ